MKIDGYIEYERLDKITGIRENDVLIEEHRKNRTTSWAVLARALKYSHWIVALSMSCLDKNLPYDKESRVILFDLPLGMDGREFYESVKRMDYAKFTELISFPREETKQNTLLIGEKAFNLELLGHKEKITYDVSLPLKFCYHYPQHYGGYEDNTINERNFKWTISIAVEGGFLRKEIARVQEEWKRLRKELFEWFDEYLYLEIEPIGFDYGFNKIENKYNCLSEPKILFVTFVPKSISIYRQRKYRQRKFLRFFGPEIGISEHEIRSFLTGFRYDVITDPAYLRIEIDAPFESEDLEMRLKALLYHLLWKQEKQKCKEKHQNVEALYSVVMLSR